MKKLLSILASFTITASATTSVIACGKIPSVKVGPTEIDGFGADTKVENFDSLYKPNTLSYVSLGILNVLNFNSKDTGKENNAAVIGEAAQYSLESQKEKLIKESEEAKAFYESYENDYSDSHFEKPTIVKSDETKVSKYDADSINGIVMEREFKEDGKLGEYKVVADQDNSPISEIAKKYENQTSSREDKENVLDEFIKKHKDKQILSDEEKENFDISFVNNTEKHEPAKNNDKFQFFYGTDEDKENVNKENLVFDKLYYKKPTSIKFNVKFKKNNKTFYLSMDVNGLTPVFARNTQELVKADKDKKIKQKTLYWFEFMGYQFNNNSYLNEQGMDENSFENFEIQNLSIKNEDTTNDQQ